MQFGQTLLHNLPLSIDPEGLNFTTTIKSGPSFATLISNTTIKLAPANCLTDFNIHTVQIKLEDEEPSSTFYSFNVSVTNLPPVFQTNAAIEDQFVQINTIGQ